MHAPCPYPVGQPVPLETGITLVLAPNPSPMTYWGTNTYLIGETDLAIIDPGPDIDDHFHALLNAIDGRRVSHIALTHTHIDHSPLARRLADATGAAVCAFGDHLAGRSDIMGALASEGLAGGGEGIDSDFKPDVHLADGDVLNGTDWALTAMHCPGHIANHLCFIWRDVVFTGDHIMGWASSLVSPPDGDLTQFMASCRRLKDIPARIYYAGHGAPIPDPDERLAWLISHRLNREAELLGALSAHPRTIPDLTKELYDDVDPALFPAAERNVFAHLIDLTQRQLVTATPVLSVTAKFTRRN